MEASEELVLKTIRERAQSIPNFFFMQIGAFDGVTDDPLHQMIIEEDWSGIVVESVKSAFEKLKENYADQQNMHVECAAVSSVGGKRNFYRIKDDLNQLPYWTKQIGSFHKDVILKHKQWVPDLERYIAEEEVSCITLEDLLSKYKVKQLNFLCIDTEGSDFEILTSLDFKTYKSNSFCLNTSISLRLKRSNLLIFCTIKAIYSYICQPIP